VRARLDPTDKAMFALAVPAFGALIAEPLYVLADTAVVASLGTSELAGLGVASAILLLVHSAALFLAYGTTARVARAVGAGRPDEATQVGISGVALALGAGVVATLVIALGAETFVGWFGASGPAAAAGTRYLTVSAFGLPAMLIALAGVGLLRGHRDTTTPLVIALVSAAANLAIELVLIVGFDQGIGASALATVIAQWGAAAVYLRKVAHLARAGGVSLRPSTKVLGELGRDARLLIIRSTALRGALVVTTAAAARLGEVPLAAHHVSFEVWSFLALALDSVAIAAQTLVGEAVGARDSVTARSVAKRAVRWSTLVGVATGAGVFLARKPLAGLFGDDPEVIALAGELLVAAALLQPLAGAVFGLDGVLIGASDLGFLAVGMVAAGATLASSSVLVVVLGGSAIWLWLGVGIHLVVRATPMLIRLRGNTWLAHGQPA